MILEKPICLKLFGKQWKTSFPFFLGNTACCFHFFWQLRAKSKSGHIREFSTHGHILFNGIFQWNIKYGHAMGAPHTDQYMDVKYAFCQNKTSITSKTFFWGKKGQYGFPGTSDSYFLKSGSTSSSQTLVLENSGGAFGRSGFMVFSRDFNIPLDSSGKLWNLHFQWQEGMFRRHACICMCWGNYLVLPD